jgi:hypothetical protein
MRTKEIPLSEACLVVRLAPASLFNEIARGRIAARKDGKKWMVDRASLGRYVTARTEAAKAAASE